MPIARPPVELARAHVRCAVVDALPARKVGVTQKNGGNRVPESLGLRVGGWNLLNIINGSGLFADMIAIMRGWGWAFVLAMAIYVISDVFYILKNLLGAIDLCRRPRAAAPGYYAPQYPQYAAPAPQQPAPAPQQYAAPQYVAPAPQPAPAAQPAPAPKFCSECGAPVEGAGVFCGKCGAKIAR